QQLPGAGAAVVVHRPVAGEDVAGAVQPQPDRRRRRGGDVVVGVGSRAAVRVPELHDRLLVGGVGRVEHEVVGRPRAQVVPDHDPGLGPEVGGAGTDQTGDNRAVPGQALVDVLHVVGDIPNVAAGGG